MNETQKKLFDIVEDRRRRRLEREDEYEHEENMIRTRKRQRENEDMENESNYFVALANAEALLHQDAERKQRGPNKQRDKSWWVDGYANWDDEMFLKKLRMKRETFNLLLNEIRESITREPTNMKQDPTTPECQLGLTIYRLAHGVSFSTLEDLFGESESNCCNVFNETCRLLVYTFYNRYVYLPRTQEEWEAELRGFIENYEFPCVGAWDGFHVYICSRLKNFYSFKKRYTMTNMGLVGHNKRFLYAAVGAPGSTHDARLLKYTSLYKDIIAGGALPEKNISLGDYGDIPLVTIGDSAFPKFPWLIKGYNENTRDPQERSVTSTRGCAVLELLQRTVMEC